MNPILKVENLSHKYASSWAIRDINFEINSNGVVGLLGSNGAGKSTTMNIICGALLQTEGDVRVNGINIQDDPIAYKKQIGFLPQQAPLYLDFTVQEYLEYSAQLRLMEKRSIKAAVEEVLEKTAITQMRSRLIKNLSGGFRQRVGIAQAIINKPRLVILDEPTNGLDPNQIIEARKLIKNIAQEHAVLLSSHVLSEINLLAREIIMIEAGRVVFSDTLDAFNNVLQPNTLMVRMLNMPGVNDLLAIDNVVKVEMLPDNKCRLHFTSNDDLSERIVKKSADLNWRLTAIHAEITVMDDVFKQLSSNFSQ
ncbi:ABC transporter ATP-binding protein [Pseudobacter ginsenosidimutans]|uniref:ABC-2 type transport system ATP-binding protein n=1 Tax=Pseudobacter ginsenosidimutans TaxID=661488 RepID=A0A4Q7MR23_9BACT|nr:ABC transporter ATP-binding protein [Pseudobacter ginsenosidimutans]QEC42142.1 ABC transporter ATP-binding protein [Pseudobacter ginsenosidimutans]RZS71017.1 ABC-2 type transport system ATP-binding protein [Pseudobacter ginsenosidimutans]